MIIAIISIALSLVSQLGYFRESLLYGSAVNRAYLKKCCIVLAGPLLATHCSHKPISILIRLVAQQDEREGLLVRQSWILYEVLMPFVNCLKRLRVRDIIAEHATVSIAVEVTTVRVYFHWIRSIPDMELNFFIFYQDSFRCKLAAHCPVRWLFHFSSHILFNNGGFTHSIITQKVNLIVVLLLPLHLL